MQNLGTKVNQIVEEQQPEIELQTPLHPRIQRFYERYGNNYKPKFEDDRPESVYDDGSTN